MIADAESPKDAKPGPSAAMHSFLATVKEAALPGVWSQGVKLARAEAVSLQEESAEEAVYRVKTPGRPIAPLAVLYPKEEEWTCDCGSKNDPCEHVVAAAIAAKEAAAQGKSVATSSDVDPQLAYRLRRGKHQNLTIERVIVYPGGREERLVEPLSRLIAGHKIPIQPTREDLEVDRLLVAAGTGPTRAGVGQGLAPAGMARVLQALSNARDVRLDDEPIEIELEPLMPIARVYDEGERVVLSVTQNPTLAEVLDRGVGLAKGKLQPLGAVELTGPRLERLPLEKAVEPHEIGELISRVLPEMERFVRVEVNSSKLPSRGGVEPPRIMFDMSPHGHTLSVLPTIVYGDPPRIRVDGDTVVHLRGDVPRRDVTAEKALILSLRERLHLVPGRLVHFDGNDAGKFAKRLQEFQESETTTFSREVMSDARLLPHIDIQGSRFEITFQTDEDASRVAEVAAVYQAWRDGLDVVPLADGGWAPLPIDWLERYGHKVADILAARRSDGEVPHYAAAPLASLCLELGKPPPPSFEALKPLFESFEGLPEAPLPEDLPATLTLRPYQRTGVNWLHFLSNAGLGAVLADDMGLGKTLQTLCAIRGKALVVSPRSVVFNWANEIKRFRPGLTSNIYHGPKRTLGSEDITITTYAVLRLDLEALIKHGFTTVILDEAQAIKNSDSQAARAAFDLSESMSESAFRVALSGTPVENRLDELWSVYRFTHPGLLGSRTDFSKRYVRPINEGNNDSAEQLRSLIKPFLLRRMKKEVAKDLPPRSDVVLTVELDEKERTLYDAVYAAKHKEVVEALEGGGSVMAALEALLRLRQAACHPSLVPGQFAETSSKVEALVEAIVDAKADDHKCIVFSQWTSFLDLVEPEFRKNDIEFVRLDGTTRDRGAVVEKFQAEDGPTVILSSLKAGGTGLNLTAADHVFLLDPWWNPAAEDQAADRAHRIGQTRPVTVYRLIAKDTIEEGILELQARKRKLADIALAEGGAAAGITRDDLLQLLAGAK
jgi:superfamily II DNA or RNA helicase